MKYFSDINGKSVEVFRPFPMKNAKFREDFGSVRGIRYDGFYMMVGRSAEGEVLPVTRKIDYKKQPSLHVCNARCTGAKATGSCECQCGGKNHGAGMFTKLLAGA